MTIALANCHKSMDAVHEVMTELDGSNCFVVINEPPRSGLGIYLPDTELRHFTNTHSTNVMIITNMKCSIEKWIIPLQDCISVQATLNLMRETTTRGNPPVVKPVIIVDYSNIKVVKVMENLRSVAPKTLLEDAPRSANTPDDESP